MQSFELKFLGVTILQGVEFPIFLLIFEWALQQCSATVLPVIHNSYLFIYLFTMPLPTIVGGEHYVFVLTAQPAVVPSGCLLSVNTGSTCHISLN